MNPFAIPALIAAILLYTLELVGWLFRTRDRVNVAFALFTGMFGTDALVNFLFLQYYDHPKADDFLWVLIVSAVLSIAGTVYFILVLTGFHDRLHARFYGLQLRTLLLAITVGIAAVLAISVFSDVIIVDVTLTRTGGFVQYGPQAWLFSVLMLPLPLTVGGMLFRALREADDPIQRRFLRINTMGLVILILAQPLFEFLLLHFQITGQFLSFVGAAIGAVFFLVALVRHQFDRIEELNATLEQKVADRTRTLREAQAKLVQSEKIASLAHLVAGVTHEFNTPLGAVRSGAATVQGGLDRVDELVQRDDADDDATRARIEKRIRGLKQAMEVVLDGTDRIASAVRRLKSFAHLDEPEVQTLDLHRGLEDAISMQPDGWRDRITIHREYGELPAITCMPVLVNQVFFNALANAIESIDDQGEIHLRTYQDNDWAVVELRDTGEGIAERHLQRIYDPGFTTKGPGVGMGLGLAIAHNVMEQHHGEITVDSEPDVGTTLRLHFPIGLRPEELDRAPFSALIQTHDN